MEVPDHTLCRALALHSLIDLFSGPPAPSYRTPYSFSSSRGVRQDMKHSVVKISIVFSGCGLAALGLGGGNLENYSKEEF